MEREVAQVARVDEKVRMARKTIRRIVVGLVLALLLVGAGFACWMTQAHHATSTAQVCLAQAQVVSDNPSEYDFGDADSAVGIVIYPGASVPYEAYAPLAQAISDEGYFVAVVQMPLNFAIFGVGEAATVMERHPQVGTWYLAGHSLGGVCAASFAHEHTDQVAGVILLAAYSSTDLSQDDLRVLSIYGSNDGVLNMAEYEGARENLPDDFTECVIEGGNHGQVGSYGAQSGDGEATISPEDQWRQTAQAIRDFIG